MHWSATSTFTKAPFPTTIYFYAQRGCHIVFCFTVDRLSAFGGSYFGVESANFYQ